MIWIYLTMGIGLMVCIWWFHYSWEHMFNFKIDEEDRID
jgi:hypothetical protein